MLDVPIAAVAHGDPIGDLLAELIDVQRYRYGEFVRGVRRSRAGRHRDWVRPKIRFLDTFGTTEYLSCYPAGSF